jgi:Tfp pilus assembly protein PilN
VEEVYKKLLSSVQEMDSLQLNRFQIARLFNLLPQITPEKITLTATEYDRGKVIFIGIAQSNEDIVILLNNISKIDWLKETNLEKINRGKKAKKDILFNLEMQIRDPNKAEGAK